MRVFLGDSACNKSCTGGTGGLLCFFATAVVNVDRRSPKFSMSHVVESHIDGISLVLEPPNTFFVTTGAWEYTCGAVLFLKVSMWFVMDVNGRCDGKLTLTLIFLIFFSNHLMFDGVSVERGAAAVGCGVIVFTTTLISLSNDLCACTINGWLVTLIT